MKVSLMLPAKENIQWRLASQLGIRYAVTKAAPELSGLPDPSDFNALKTVHGNFAAAGFELYALEGDEFDMSRIKLGLPGRDEDIEKYRRMLENMGRLGIRLLCLNFMAGIGWFRSRTDLPERGGARTSGFDVRDIPGSDGPLHLSEDELRRNLLYFLHAVLPAAENAGVRLGLHPDDPPLSPLFGWPRILTSAEAFRRILRDAESPALGITFCQATFRVMGENVMELIREFGEKIFFLHFRDAEGTRTSFRETFHDNGPTDMAGLLETAQTYAPGCLLRPDHTPAMAGEEENTGYTMLGNIFAAGYIRGLLDAQKHYHERNISCSD